MASRYAIDKAGVRERIDKLVGAIRAMDLDGVKSNYASDMVSFDMGPPLRHVGAEAKWNNWAGFFAAFQNPVGYEVHDLAIAVGDHVAFAYSLNRVSGAFKDGRRADHWVRWTACLRKIDGAWLIAHDHVSVPLDVTSGRALLDLKP
jgi:ketosteroid isomerase-like protein